MLISDSIAQIIEQMLEDGGGSTEVRRAELAARLGCVPSQVKYVITSRFTPERGYITESRRGGGGYIRIARVSMERSEYLMHFFHAVGDSIDEGEAMAFLRNLRDNGVIEPREAEIMAASLSEKALARVEPRGRAFVRADVMRHVLLSLLK